MDDLMQSLYAPALAEFGFVPEPGNQRYGKNGVCWRQADAAASGYYWIYEQKGLFNIKIHDFCFYEDRLLEFHIPECLSVTLYESIDGMELPAKRRLIPGCVKTFLGGREPYRVLIRKDVPIKSIGIEIAPAYYEDWLRRQYPDEYQHPLEAFRMVGQTSGFPEMVRLLEQVRDFRGEGIAARLFYEGKTAEAVARIVERGRRPPAARPLADGDRRQIETATAYINAHFAQALTLGQLARIACMGTTKLKNAFRQHHGCTITAYIQQQRIGRAKALLAETELPVRQVAQAVGYHSASRFAELFRRSEGVSPLQYRREHTAAGGK